jgi:hypothetical protein
MYKFEVEEWELEADKVEIRGRPSYRSIRETILAGEFDGCVYSQISVTPSNAQAFFLAIQVAEMHQITLVLTCFIQLNYCIAFRAQIRI